MPMPTTAKWPKPKNEDEFEDMVVDFLRLRWKDPHATRNGRRGQGQHGVDVTGRPPWGRGRTAGAQSKNTESPTLRTVTIEVEKAKGFEGGLCEFLFVTAADRDSELQAEVREHYAAHPVPFPVELVFWQDITADLSTDDRMVGKHWKGFPGASLAPASIAPPPRWLAWSIDWEGASDFQFEFVIWSTPSPNLDVSELSSEIEIPARQGVGGPIVGHLLRQNAIHGDQSVTWSIEDRPYSNVSRRWELEVSERGLMIFRWGERTTGSRYVDIVPFVEGMLFPLAIYKVAMEGACRRASAASPSKIGVRLAALGNGPLLLNDTVPMMNPNRRLSAPESPAEWSFESAIEPSLPTLDSGKRLLNRALARFKPGPVPAFWRQADASSFLSIDEATLHKLYGSAIL